MGFIITCYNRLRDSSLQLLPDLSRFPRLHRRWWLLLAASTLFGYEEYKIYHLTTVPQTLQLPPISSDLTHFLHSDSADLPSGLKQISKITCSDEFYASIFRISEALTRRSLVCSNTENWLWILGNTSMDKLLSPAGSRISSVVANSFSKGLVMGFYASESIPARSGIP